MYAFFTIASGVALIVLALVPGIRDFSTGRRFLTLLVGIGFVGYGIAYARANSGTWHFPVIIFILPFIIGFFVVNQALENRGDARQLADDVAGADRSGAEGSSPSAARGALPVNSPDPGFLVPTDVSTWTDFPAPPADESSSAWIDPDLPPPRHS